MPHGGYRIQNRDERLYERNQRNASAERGRYNRQWANPDEVYFAQEGYRQEPDFDRQHADRGYAYEYNQPAEQQRYGGTRSAQRRGYAGQSGVHEDDDIYGDQYSRQRPPPPQSYARQDIYPSQHSRGMEFEPSYATERGDGQSYYAQQNAGQPGYGSERYVEQRYAYQPVQTYGQPYGYNADTYARPGRWQDYRQGAAPPPDQQLEPDYLRWREEQLGGYDRQFLEWRLQEAKKYDTEYSKWRQERQDKFNRDFTDWRKTFEAKHGSSTTAGAGSLHAMKDDDKSDKAKLGKTTTM
jgi:hypothetical protein